MSKPNAADLPGSMVVLGMLIEEPDLTVAEVADRLKTRFPSCRFDRNTAGTALRQMAREGRSRPRVRCVHREPGRSRLKDRYRVTQAGIKQFSGWMYAMPVGVPALREALYGRIELCSKIEDLPELIRMAREERDVSADLFSNAKSTLQKHLDRNRRRGKPQEPPGPEAFLQETRNVLLHMTPEHWSGRSQHYDEISRRLEDIATRAGIDFPTEP